MAHQLVGAPNDPPDASQDGRPADGNERRALHNRRADMAYGFVADLGQPHLLERYVRDVERRRAAYVIETVDALILVVFLRMVGQPLLGEGDHLIALPETEGAGGAGLDAGRLQTVADAVDAEGALADLRPLRQAGVPGEGRHVEGAGHHAVAAADALVLVPEHRAIVVLLQGAHGAGGHAGGVLAVHAATVEEAPLQLPVDLHLLEVDYPPGVRVERGRVGVAAGVLRLNRRKVVPLLAGDLTAAAPGAPCLIDQ